MAATDEDTMREIATALRRHVDQKSLQQVINDLLDLPGNKSFRDRDRNAGARAVENLEAGPGQGV